MSAPVFFFAISKVARMISLIVVALASSIPSSGIRLAMKLRLPSCSSAFRSSGWKMTTVAMMAAVEIRSISHMMVVR